MWCRKHNYVYTQGYFFCTKCGHRRYSDSYVGRNHYPTRKKKHYVTIASIYVVIIVVGLFVYQQYGNSILNYIQTVKPQDTIINTLRKTLEVKPTNMTAIAFYIHDLINEQRKTSGLPPLSWNPKIAQAALNHSTDMAKRNYFEHENPEGHDFSYRYSQIGFNCQIPISQYRYSGGGENIMFMEGYYGEEKIASEIVTGWMNSTGHRQNILTSYFLSEGIGVAESKDGKIYATQDFC